jgi:hypothetical protein
MATLIDSLNDITLDIFMYAGLIEWVACIIGNGLTLLVFSRAPLYSTRTAPYLMALAAMNLVYLTHGLLTRGIAAANGLFDATFGNDIACRFRYFVPYISITMIFSLLSWMAFDT